MIDYKQGDIVLIPFPFTDLSTLKQRPAVILSARTYNARHSDVIICAITSHVSTALESYDHLLSYTESLSVGLIKTSIIKCDKIITIDKRLIHKKIGHLPTDILRIVIQKLQTVFN